MKRVILVLVCALLAATCVGCIHKQMLLVTPYPDGTGRVGEIAEALDSGVRGQQFSATLNVFNMNSTGHPTDIWREQMRRMAVVRANALRPGVIFVAGDDAARFFAQGFLARPYNFIFLGVKGDPAEYGFTKALNVTGVREEVPVREAFSLMKRLVPSTRGVGVIADASLEGDAVVQRIQRAADLPIRVVAVRRARTLPEWMAAVSDLQTKADALCIASYRSVLPDEKAREAIAPAELLRMTAEANKLPDFSFWPDAVGLNGVLAAVTVPADAQARIAAKMAIRVMYLDVKTSDIRITSCNARATKISRERAAKLGITIPVDADAIHAVPRGAAKTTM